MLFVPMVHISHAQLSPLQLLPSLNAFIQVNIMGTQHDMQIHTPTRFTAFLLTLLLGLQAGQLALDSHVGNTYNNVRIVQ
jgi:hypothetical protein